MANTHKKLGQSKPVAATNTTIYTVPSVTTVIIGSIVICNVGIDADLMRIFIVPSGGAAGVSNAIYYDVEIYNRDTVLINPAVTVEAGGFISVYSRDGDLTFTASGLEIK